MIEIKRGNITLQNFIELNATDLKELLNWRNDANVRSKMKSSVIIKENEHFAFVKNLKESKKSFYWLARRKDIKIGTVYLQLDENENMAEWGYYLAPDFIGSGLGLELAYESIHIFFEEFGIDQLNGIVKDTNKENFSLQEILKFQLQETRKDGFFHYYMSKMIFKTLPKTYKEFKKNLLK